MRESFVAEIDAIAGAIFNRVLPVFDSVNEEAERVEQQEWDRRGQLWSEDEGDPAADAEHARDLAVDYLLTMERVKQGTLNLLGAGLYHLVEQQMLRFLRCGVLGAGEEHRARSDDNWGRLVSLSELKRRLNDEGVDLASLQSWSAIEQLQLFANTVKHAEGWSYEKLFEQRPDLFVHPWERDAGDPTPRSGPLYQPLFGQGLYLSGAQFGIFVEQAKSFWVDLAAALEATR